jgi:hypothetical protein
MEEAAPPYACPARAETVDMFPTMPHGSFDLSPPLPVDDR